MKQEPSSCFDHSHYRMLACQQNQLVISYTSLTQSREIMTVEHTQGVRGGSPTIFAAGSSRVVV